MMDSLKIQKEAERERNKKHFLTQAAAIIGGV